MSIWDRDLRGNVRNDIGIVDHSPSFRNFSCDKGGEGLVSNPGSSKSVELFNMTEHSEDVSCSNACKSSSHTVSSHKYFSISVESGEFLNFSSDVSFNAGEGIIEALVDIATRAARVGDLSGIEVDDPVLNTNCTSESHDDSIIGRGVASVAKDVEDGVVECFGLKIVK